jgi:hypothetical protein
MEMTGGWLQERIRWEYVLEIDPMLQNQMYNDPGCTVTSLWLTPCKPTRRIPKMKQVVTVKEVFFG